MTTKKPRPDAPLQVDWTNGWLWRGSERLALTPKQSAVLRCLVEQAGQVVSKDTLLQTVWPDTVVSEDALKFCIRQLRVALGDHAKTPQYLQTVHGRGYRWIASLATAPPVQSVEQFGGSVQNAGLRTSDSGLQESLLVGREAELGQLHEVLEKAQHGERQLVFLSGEAGIGKTSLIDAFVAQVGTGGQDAAAGREQRADTATRRRGDTESEGQAPRPPFTASPRLSFSASSCFLPCRLSDHAL